MLTIQADIWHQIKGWAQFPTVTSKNHAEVFKVIIRITNHHIKKKLFKKLEQILTGICRIPADNIGNVAITGGIVTVSLQ